MARHPRPRIYWVYYPKSNRGYWRVTPYPDSPKAPPPALWLFAYRMAFQMNSAVTNR